PIAAVLDHVFGAASARAVAVLAGLIVAANLNGAIWAASRSVFASAPEGVLPPELAHVDAPAVVPRRGRPARSGRVFGRVGVVFPGRPLAGDLVPHGRPEFLSALPAERRGVREAVVVAESGVVWRRYAPLVPVGHGVVRVVLALPSRPGSGWITAGPLPRRTD